MTKPMSESCCRQQERSVTAWHWIGNIVTIHRRLLEGLTCQVRSAPAMLPLIKRMESGNEVEAFNRNHCDGGLG